MARWRSLKQPAKVDLCKIDTTRLRALDYKQIIKVQIRTGGISDLPAKPTQKWPAPVHLLVRFVHALRENKKPVISLKAFHERAGEAISHPGTTYHVIRNQIATEHPDVEAMTPRYYELVKKYVQADVEHQQRMRSVAASDVEHYEKKIWARQAKAGCKLRPEEAVARDAIEQGTPERAAEARASGRRPPTPHRRPAKIR